MKIYVLYLAFLLLPLFSLAAQEKPDATALYRSGRDLEARGRTDEANTYYNEAVRICLGEISGGSATMDTYAVLTWTLQRQRKYAEVIRWGQQALQIRDDYRIIETMGEAYFYLPDYDASLRSMQRYAAGMPQGDRASVAYFFMGEIYRFQKKYQHADIAYTAAVQLEPGMALWWYRLGTVREAASEFSAAADAFERALKINSSYTEAGEALARIRKPAA